MDKPVCMVQGRIVWVVGDLFKGQLAKQYGTNISKLNKQGEQFNEYGFGLAVPKSAIVEGGAGWDLWCKMHQVAYTLFPNRVIPNSFHMKVIDGDTGVTKEGVQVNTKEGYPGHMVFTLKSTFPIKFFKLENGSNVQINEGVKCGDYVNVQLNIDINRGVNASLYLNPMAAQLIGYGKEIITAPSGDTIFGTSKPALPQGASEIPFTTNTSMLVPNGTQPQFQPPGMGQPSQFQPQQQQQQVNPNYGVLPQQFQPTGMGQPQQQQQYAPPQTQFQPPGMGQPQMNQGGIPMPR